MAIKLKVQETESARFKVSGVDRVALSVEQGIPIYPEYYTDAYEVTPIESEQSLDTSGLMMSDNVSVHAVPGDYVGSAISRRSSTDLTASGATVTAPSGYYAEDASKSVANGTEGTPTATKGTVSSHSISVTPSVTNSAGYISGGTHTGTAVTVSASELVSGTLNITSSGTKDVTNYASASVAAGSATTPATSITANPTISVDASTGVISASVSGSKSVTPTVSAGYVSSGTSGAVSVSGSATESLSTQAATTITPTTSEQTAVPANTYTLGDVKVSAMPTGAKNAQVNTWGWTSTTKKLTITFPNATSGYYTGSAAGAVTPVELYRQTETVTPTETAQEVTPTNGIYYLEKVTVDAIPSNYVGSAITQRDSTDLSASGATVTAPAGYYASAATKTISSGSAIPTASISASSASKVIGNGTITLSKTVANTPQVMAGYITSGTQGNTNVELTASVTTKGATTYHPSTSDQSISAATYLTGAQTIKAVTHNLTAGDIKDGVTLKIGDSTDDDCVASVTGTYTGGGGTPNLQAKTNIDPTTSSQTITADTGYDGLSSVQINAMPSGSATPAASISSTGATVSTGTNTLTLSKSSVSNTPQVSAGYVSSGTAGNSSVSLTASVTTKAAATYYAGTSDQTINASQYLTGAQTIKAVSQTNLAAENIKSGTTVSISNGNGNIWSVTGTYSGGGISKNTQVVQGTTRTTSSTMTAIGAELTVSKTGTYDIYWSAFRSSTSTSYTYATQLYIDSTAHGSENATWSNHCQNNHLTSVSLTSGQKLRVRGRESRNSSYYIYAPMLCIVEN